MSDVISKVRIHSLDFFKGYLENRDNALYNSIAEIHDLALLERADLSAKELATIVEESKFLLKSLVQYREDNKNKI